MQHVFPFSEVRQGSAIVVYGAGLVGYDYYLQIKSIDYCRLLFMVDRNFSGMGDCLPDVTIRPPEALLESDYDHVVVAVHTKRSETEIVGRLEQMGVSPEKIVCNNRAMIGDGWYWDRDASPDCRKTGNSKYWVRTNGLVGGAPQRSWNIPASASHPGEDFYFDVARARELHPDIRGIAIIFFCGVGDYLYGTPAFACLKKEFPNLDLYGYVSKNTDNNNSPQVRRLLETNPHFQKTFYYDGKPCPGLWKNYDYSDAIKDIPDDFIVVPFVYKYSSGSDHRIVEIFDMLCLKRPLCVPRPALYPHKQERQHVRRMADEVTRLGADSRGICIVQFEHRSTRYAYRYINELIEMLLVENYFVIPTSQEVTVSHPRLAKLDFSVFDMADSIELFRLLAEASPDIRFLGCNSMSWALSGALNVPNLSVQHIRDEKNHALWFPNITVITPVRYPRIPVFWQHLDTRNITAGGERWDGSVMEYFEYRPNTIMEHFRQFVECGETAKRGPAQ